jgi:anti-sigma regulatory factor (Ser/Thr protein kinase)
MNATPTVRTDEAATRQRQWPYSPRSVGHARRQLADVCAESGMAHLADTAALVLSELMTNALRHGRRTHEHAIATRFTPTADGMRVEVHDTSSARPRLKQAATDDENGRGLALVNALTHGRWGVTPTTTGDGKTVWALIGPELD